MQHDERSVLGLEVAERPLDEVAIREVSGRIGCRRAVPGQQVRGERPAPPAAEFIKRRMHEEAMQPGIESIRITQARQIAPGSDERVLDGVLSEIPIPQDEARRHVEAGRRRGGQHREGVMIATSRPFDELPSFHSPSPTPRRRSPDSKGMASWQADSFQEQHP